jgi:ethanolamine ammonia-lyase small subunit
VHAPQPGNTDAHHNCVSNIRPEGLSIDAAASTIHYLLSEARRRRMSGVQLKDQRLLADAAAASPTSLPSHGDGRGMHSI